MKKQFIIGIYIDTLRTRIILLEVADEQVLDTIISQTESKYIEKFLNQIEHALEVLQKKIVFLKGVICEIRIFLPAAFSEMEDSDLFALEFTDLPLLKNIVERRFLLPCRIYSWNNAS